MSNIFEVYTKVVTIYHCYNTKLNIKKNLNDGNGNHGAK